jgi:hypothetical protein
MNIEMHNSNIEMHNSNTYRQVTQPHFGTGALQIARPGVVWRVCVCVCGCVCVVWCVSVCANVCVYGGGEGVVRELYSPATEPNDALSPLLQNRKPTKMETPRVACVEVIVPSYSFVHFVVHSGRQIVQHVIHEHVQLVGTQTLFLIIPKENSVAGVSCIVAADHTRLG